MSYVNMWPKGLSNPSSKPPQKRSADGNSDQQPDMEDMRGRHPMFRVPQWFSEDEAMGNFGRRPHPQNWPWGEQRHPGGPGKMGEDVVDSHPGLTIPIRIEAEAPPGYEPQPAQEQPSVEAKDGFEPQMKIGNQPAYASKTTTAVDTCKEEVPRDTRSSSAPPDMNADQAPNGMNAKNTEKPPPIEEEPRETGCLGQANSTQAAQDPNFPQSYPHPPQQNFAHPQQIFQQQPQYNYQQSPPTQGFQQQTQSPRMNRGQRPSVVRNIPIMVEGRDEPMPEEPRSPRMANTVPPQQPNNPPPTQQQPQPQHWQKPYSNIPPEFAQEAMFNDPFFNFSGSPTMGRQQPFQQQQQGPFPQQSPPNSHFQQQERSNQKFPQQPQPQKAPPVPKPEQPANDTPSKVPDQPPKPQEPPKDHKMEKIKAVRASLTEYQDQVSKFSGSEKNKEFLYLDEMLTRCLLELDNIDPDGRDDVRQSRKTLIKDITGTISLLETKLANSGTKEKKDEPMDTNDSVNNSKTSGDQPEKATTKDGDIAQPSEAVKPEDQKKKDSDDKTTPASTEPDKKVEDSSQKNGKDAKAP